MRNVTVLERSTHRSINCRRSGGKVQWPVYWHCPHTMRSTVDMHLSVCLSQHRPTAANPLLKVCCLSINQSLNLLIYGSSKVGLVTQIIKKRHSHCKLFNE